MFLNRGPFGPLGGNELLLGVHANKRGKRGSTEVDHFCIVSDAEPLRKDSNFTLSLSTESNIPVVLQAYLLEDGLQKMK